MRENSNYPRDGATRKTPRWQYGCGGIAVWLLGLTMLGLAGGAVLGEHPDPVTNQITQYWYQPLLSLVGCLGGLVAFVVGIWLFGKACSKG